MHFIFAYISREKKKGKNKTKQKTKKQNKKTKQNKTKQKNRLDAIHYKSFDLSTE